MDNVLNALAQDEVLLEEEERIALFNIKKIIAELQESFLTQERFRELQKELLKSYKRFIQNAKQIAKNSSELVHELELLYIRGKLGKEIKTSKK